MLPVNSFDQIKKNILQLDSYLRSSNYQEVEFAKSIIRNGICFVIFKNGDRIIFAPSRFIGYINNSMFDHLRNEHKDGKETNPAIESVLGFAPIVDPNLENEYRQFCIRERTGFRLKGPFNKERKYWKI